MRTLEINFLALIFIGIDNYRYRVSRLLKHKIVFLNRLLRDFNDRRSAKVLLSVLSLLFNYEKKMRILIEKIFIGIGLTILFGIFVVIDISEVSLKNKFEN